MTACEEPSGENRAGFHSIAQLLILAAAMGVGGYTRTAISPLQESMRVALSLSDNQMALLQGPAIGIPVTLAAIPLGLLIDKFSRKRLLLALVVTSLIGSALTAVSTNFALLLFARALAGVAGLGVLPVVFSMVADLYAPALRGRVTTVIIVGQVVGNSAAFALGGGLLTVLGSTSNTWRWAMMWLTAVLVPIAILMFVVKEPTRTAVVVKNPSLGQVWAELKQYSKVVGMLSAGIIAVETAIGAILIWGSPMLSRMFYLSPGSIGTIMATGMIVSGIAGPMIGGLLADVFQKMGGPRLTATMLCVFAFAAAPTALFAFLHRSTLVSAMLVIDMTMMLVVAVMGMSLFTIVIPNELRGLCMSILIAAILLFSLAVAPLAVSLVSGALGGPAYIGTALSSFCVFASFFACASFLFARRHVLGAGQTLL